MDMFLNTLAKIILISTSIGMLVLVVTAIMAVPQLIYVVTMFAYLFVFIWSLKRLGL